MRQFGWISDDDDDANAGFYYNVSCCSGMILTSRFNVNRARFCESCRTNGWLARCPNLARNKFFILVRTVLQACTHFVNFLLNTASPMDVAKTTAT